MASLKFNVIDQQVTLHYNISARQTVEAVLFSMHYMYMYGVVHWCVNIPFPFALSNAVGACSYNYSLVPKPFPENETGGYKASSYIASYPKRVGTRLVLI